MGRKRNVGKIDDPLIMKNRHRCADTKYRQNIQYLHDLLKDNFNEKSTKSSLLNTVLANIGQMEKDIVNICGSQTLTDYKQEFSKLYKLEESIWKKEKDPCEWWDKVQDMIKQLLKKNMDASSVLEVFSKYLDKDGSPFVTSRTTSRMMDSAKRGRKRSNSQFTNISGIVPNYQGFSYDSNDGPLEKYFNPEYLLNNPEWNA